MKLLWAVEVFENHPRAIKAATQFLSALNERVTLKVHAVSVVREPKIQTPPASKRDIRNLLHSRLDHARKEKWFKSDKVIFESQIPQRVSVIDLVEFAKNGNFDGIVAVKHSKIGRKPASLGTFAEMLAFISPLPIFLVNPDGAIPERIENLILASDATEKCSHDFQVLSKFLPLSAVTIRIQHRIPVVFPEYLSKEDEKEFGQSEARTARACLARVQELASKAGATTKVVMRQERKCTEAVILREAKKSNSDLIVLNHRGKGAIGFFLGRITRRILQEADRPVLLLRV